MIEVVQICSIADDGIRNVTEIVQRSAEPWMMV